MNTINLQPEIYDFSPIQLTQFEKEDNEFKIITNREKQNYELFNNEYKNLLIDFNIKKFDVNGLNINDILKIFNENYDYMKDKSKEKYNKNGEIVFNKGKQLKISKLRLNEAFISTLYYLQHLLINNKIKAISTEEKRYNLYNFINDKNIKEHYILLIFFCLNRLDYFIVDSNQDYLYNNNLNQLNEEEQQKYNNNIKTIKSFRECIKLYFPIDYLETQFDLN